MDLQLSHDINFTIATAPQRFSKKWKHSETTWAHLLERLSKPAVTGETVAEYKKMKKADRDNRKDVGGFVCGRLKNGQRLKQNVEYRQVICLDADSPAKDFLMDLNIGIGDCAWGLYSTHSSTPEAPRYRILIPLNRKVSPDEYKAISRLLAKDINIDAMDPTTYEPERLMYWPSRSHDGTYVFKYNDESILSADKVLNRYDDWRDTSLWPTSKKEAEITVSTAKRQGDPLTKPGLIGAFCRAYTVEEAIETFLSDEYVACDIPGRYTYKKGSTSAGLVVYDNKFAYSHHSTDPTGGKLCNAFDLVRIHRFGDKDENTGTDTPANKLPSFLEMVKLAGSDEKTKTVLGKEQAAELAKEFDSVDIDVSEEDFDWMKDLERGSGKNAPILPTAGNFILILKNDPLLKNTFGLDDFTHRLSVKADLPWRKMGKDRIWRDDDDARLRNHLSQYYKLTGRQVIDDALSEVMHLNAFHPVKDYLKSLPKWDGEPRAETLFIKYLGAEDTKYVRDVTKSWLKAAVARVMNPGVKYDYCIVLSGPQGIGKSTILYRLGRSWYNDSLTSFQGKDAMELLIGSWIVELSEMQASTKADNDMIKAFLSRREDKFRAPYGRRTEIFPRQCVFAATTNDSIFLKDRTGGRRFMPVFCKGENIALFDELDEKEIGRVWAEVLYAYGSDKNLLLPADSAKAAKELQEEHTEGSEKRGLIEAYLDKKLPKDWANMGVYERREYLENYDAEEIPPESTERDKVCALEIWCEVFEGNRRNFRNTDAREMNAILQSLSGWKSDKKKRFGGLYGIQKSYIREK